ncbi:hypothetical protein amad1_03480 [Alteromonas mediterranea DE1]|jgi:hypothetical protein|uniref:Uncharacterized protein n=1 Tax=Alteromonas mediterranea 615 TaxID=1300253 RepID=S5A9G3_9ALTE|nr:hypothetical protein amad1_03480 [Alteromonas mediterranea DE1]AGP76987.1 hypothetical protein I633_03515 [Alteromonas mediterranea 615]AGP84483.1 hypothetical protein I607_03365 [Alteromonas mediterranea U4]AGP88600.1 hypothetical protein I876_03575 [Alteromonas mediterranea U7]AGP92485.1 hypothetical protein I634_03725 [Alteromonas mediterranea U8]AGP96230.1 hypothetical protein I635_03445 [Alteromonas mediterranea UM7]AGQ00564.1 hypothetical protein I636_03470 [Alteromonas mediterranea 
MRTGIIKPQVENQMQPFEGKQTGYFRIDKIASKK